MYLDITMLSKCGTLEVVDKHRYDTSSTRYKQKACWSWHGNVDNVCNLVAAILPLEFLASFWWIKTKLNIYHVPFGEVLNHASRSQEYTW